MFSKFTEAGQYNKHNRNGTNSRLAYESQAQHIKSLKLIQISNHQLVKPLNNKKQNWPAHPQNNQQQTLTFKGKYRSNIACQGLKA